MEIRDSCDIAILKASYNVLLGQTIYVRWIVGTESNNSNIIENDFVNEEVVWWPGKVIMDGKEERDSRGRRVYILEYEEREGFSSDRCRIVFENSEKVIHLDYNGLSLRFCRSENEIRNIENCENNEEERTLTLQEILEGELFGSSGAEESEAGDSESIINIFNSLPHEKQINLAQGYREFADKFIMFLRNRINNNQDKNTVTVEDIQDFIEFLGLNNADNKRE